MKYLGTWMTILGFVLVITSRSRNSDNLASNHFCSDSWCSRRESWSSTIFRLESLWDAGLGRPGSNSVNILCRTQATSWEEWLKGWLKSGSCRVLWRILLPWMFVDVHGGPKIHCWTRFVTVPHFAQVTPGMLKLGRGSWGVVRRWASGRHCSFSPRGCGTPGQWYRPCATFSSVGWTCCFYL